MFTNEFKVLTPEQVQRVHELTLQVLREKGVMFYSEKAKEILKKHGAKLDGDCVKFPPHLVNSCIAQAPSGFLWQARDSHKSIYVGEGQEKKVYIMQNHGPVYVQERQGNRRHGSMEDVRNFYKLGQTSHVNDFVGQVSVDPHEVNGLDKQLRITHELLKHTDKPMLSYPATNYQDNVRVMDMLDMILGENYLADHYCITASVCLLSPLQCAEESADCIIAYAERNQPVTVLCAPMLGVSTPISPIGALVAQNAEILAGLVLAQVVRPGVPVIYGTATYSSDMRSGAYVTSSPEVNLVDRAALQLCQQIYHLPTRTLAGNTDAKIADIQAGYETMQNYIQLFMGGTHMVNECLGILDGMMTVSYEKYIIDEEMIDRVHLMMAGLPTNELDFNIDNLLSIPHTESFLFDQQTLDACKDQWVPQVSCWTNYDQWNAEGQICILEKAAKICEERLQSAPDDLLGKELNTSLESYIKKQY